MTAVGGMLPQEQPEVSRERGKNETSTDDPAWDQRPAKRQKLDVDTAMTNGSANRVLATLVKPAQVRLTEYLPKETLTIISAAQTCRTFSQARSTNRGIC